MCDIQYKISYIITHIPTFLNCVHSRKIKQKISTLNAWVDDLISGSSPFHLKSITGSKHQITLERLGNSLGKGQKYEKQHM